jgi:plasmid stabilization system protein ParE
MTRKYRVNIAGTAEDDVRRIHGRIAKDKPKAAARWVREFRRLAKSLSHLPLRYEVIPEAEDLPINFRHVLFGNYRIVYQVGDKDVTILHVVHAGRLLDPSFFEET